VVSVPLRQGINELVEAIEDRIEVTGRAPTWRVTAGSFESAMSYAREAYHDPVVVGRSDQHRLWPRVTLTVTTDPVLASSAPPLEELVRPRIPQQPKGAHRATRAPAAPRNPVESSLEEFFSHAPVAARRWSLPTVAPVLLVVLASLAVGLSVLGILYLDY
jgi:hypothetical protein